MKWLKRIGIGLLATVILANLLILITGETYLYTVLANTVFKGRLGPDIDEYEAFENREVPAGTAQPWPEGGNYNDESLPKYALEELEELESVAFLIVQNDSIRYEHYWEGYGPESRSNSFSMAKSIVSILVGIAIKEGKIESVHQPVSDFLPGFDSELGQKLTIYHLLTMSSGMNFDENYINPFAFPARANYGDDLRELVSRYEVAEEPGQTFLYLSGNTQLLSFVLQEATGQKLSDYASEKLWKPIGASETALWTLDDVDGEEKAFCCFNSNARDFARIGQLYLRNGNWKGLEIVEPEYAQASTQPADLQEKDGSANRRYGYSWWVTQIEDRPVFYARGILGQYILVIPDLDMVVVRLGHKRNKKMGDLHPREVEVYLQAAVEMYGS